MLFPTTHYSIKIMKKKYKKIFKKGNSTTIVEFEWGSKKQIITGVIIFILIALIIVKVVG